MLATSTTLPHLDRYQHATNIDGLHTFHLPHRSDENLPKAITIRLADRDGERNCASMLINRKYSRRGFGQDHKAPTAKNCVTFTASAENSVIGTLSLTVDSQEGLACDRTFKEELDKFREIKGSQLCELTKFAFDTSNPSLHLLASLFHIIFIYGTHRYNCTDLFIEVNPRHRRFYERMLGFQRVGEPKINEAVGASSHLMWLKVSDIRRHIDHHAGRRATSHSLYPYFFSVKEEVGIYGRLSGELTELQPTKHGRLHDRAGFIARLNRQIGGVLSFHDRLLRGRRPIKA